MQEYLLPFFGVLAIIIIALMYWFFTQALTLLKYISIMLEELAFEKDVKKVEKTFLKPVAPSEDKLKIIMNGWGI